MIRLARTTIIASIAAAVAMAAPAGAQQYSEGYKFIEAVKKKDGNEVQMMLDKPGTTVVNARDISTGRTALHFVVDRRDVTWIRYLGQQGANPNIADDDGVTPLMLASRLGFIEGVQALIGVGAQVNVANKAGETPLIFGILSRNRPLVEVLLQAGADAERRDNAGRSARDYASDDARMMDLIAEHSRPAGESEAKVYGPSF